MVLHIGLHKTATSFLQRRVFPRLEGVAFAGYPPMGGQTVKLVARRARRDAPLLLSDENLSGHPFRGRWIEEFEESVRGLALLFPEARVIVGFRAHGSWLVSVYKQYLNKGGTLTLREFLGFGDTPGIVRQQDTDFGRRLDLLEALFPGRVFVHTQEEIANALASFMGDLCAFLGVPTLDVAALPTRRDNVGVGGRQARLLRHLNRVDAMLRKAVVLPTLNNRIFEKLSLDPRRLCQQRLAGLGPGTPLALPPEVGAWAPDWDREWTRVEAARARRGAVIAGS
jgi:hypothetical protein